MDGQKGIDLDPPVWVTEGILLHQKAQANTADSIGRWEDAEADAVESPAGKGGENAGGLLTAEGIAGDVVQVAETA